MRSADGARRSRVPRSVRPQRTSLVPPDRITGSIAPQPGSGHASGVSFRSRRDEIGADIVLSGDESWAKISQRVTVLCFN